MAICETGRVIAMLIVMEEEMMNGSKTSCQSRGKQVGEQSCAKDGLLLLLALRRVALWIQAVSGRSDYSGIG
jgi:hypothetical protein